MNGITIFALIMAILLAVSYVLAAWAMLEAHAAYFFDRPSNHWYEKIRSKRTMKARRPNGKP